MTQLKKLFEPIEIGKVELKNRLVMAAYTTYYGDGDRVSERLRKGCVSLERFKKELIR